MDGKNSIHSHIGAQVFFRLFWWDFRWFTFFFTFFGDFSSDEFCNSLHSSLFLVTFLSPFLSLFATDTVVAFAHQLKNGHLAVGFRLTVHRQKYESITLHPNLFPEMKGVNLLLKTHRNNDKSNLKLKTVLQELLHVDIFSWQTKPSFFSSHPIHLVCL